MAYIAPDSTIQFMQDVPLSFGSQHTLYFDTLANQNTWFNQRVEYTLYNQYYVNKDNIKEVQVSLPRSSLINCNYMRFRNSSYENKWFYAYITDVKYKNNENTVVTYEIDEMQTWFFEQNLKPSFVERTHVTNDEVGLHRVEENLDFGSYVYEKVQNTPVRSMLVAVYTAFRTSYDGGVHDWILDKALGPPGEFISSDRNNHPGLFSATDVIVFANLEDVQAFFEKVSSMGLQDGIVAVYMVPTAHSNGWIFYKYGNGPYRPQMDTHDVNISRKNNIEGYVPRNQKLLTAPYNLIYIMDNQGNSHQYNYEDFSTDTATFKQEGVVFGKPEMQVVPTNYKGVDRNINEKLSIHNMPMVSYNTDSYKAWLAQNSVSMGLNVGSAAVTAGLGLATGGALSTPLLMGAGLSLSNSIKSYLSQGHKESLQPRDLRGNQSSGNINVYNNEFGFHYYRSTIRREYAVILDEYFTMFGYQVNSLETPNRKARNYFTYIKTQGVNIIGNMPTTSLDNIKEQFDTGITFWDIVNCETRGATVGDYDKLNNSIVAGGGSTGGGPGNAGGDPILPPHTAN